MRTAAPPQAPPPPGGGPILTTQRPPSPAIPPPSPRLAGNLIRQNKLYFATEQGKEINNLVREYVNHLCIA